MSRSKRSRPAAQFSSPTARDRRMRVAVLGRRAGRRESACRRSSSERAAQRGRRRARAPRAASQTTAARGRSAADGWAISALSVARPEVARGVEHEPREHAGRASRRACAGGILDLDAPAREFGGDARAGDRRIGRDQRGGLARRLQSFAHRDGERERLLGSRSRRRCIATPARASSIATGESAASRSRQLCVDSAGRSASLSKALARAARRSARRAPSLRHARRRSLRAGGAAPPADGRRAPFVGVARADHRPGGVVEVQVEIGQHDGALAARARPRAMSAAVARLVPVEPAMIVGPRATAGSRRVDFRIDGEPVRVARSTRPRSSSQRGQRRTRSSGIRA